MCGERYYVLHERGMLTRITGVIYILVSDKDWEEQQYTIIRTDSTQLHDVSLKRRYSKAKSKENIDLKEGNQEKNLKYKIKDREYS